VSWAWLDWLREAIGQPQFTLLFAPTVKFLVAVFSILLLIAYLVFAERRLLGFLQVRLGPNRVGPWGLLQPIADVLKLLIKEDTIPNRAVRWAYLLAPCLVVAPALIIISVIPFGPSPIAPGAPRWYVTDLNAALVFVVALASLGIYGIILGGWASNNKFSLLGGLRSAAQMVSYEVPQGLALVGPLMLAGSLSLVGIVEGQARLGLWFAVPQVVAFFVYFVAGVAETNRNPFDLPEAESELVAGFHTEYSGVRFALFFLGEYANMIVIAAIAVTVFLGGWLRPFPSVEALAFLDFVPGIAWFFLKVFAFLFLFIWFRGTFPRFRFDQLMALGWKWLIPLSLANVLVTGLVVVLVDRGP
jgi:NADH-quinone oxidoreductase subunit H